MNRFGAALTFVAVLAYAWASFSWFEAEKEMRLLCAALGSGEPVPRATKVLDTGHYLRYARADGDSGPVIEVTSAYTLGSAHCTLRIADERVVSSVYRAPVRLEWVAGAVAVALLVGVAGLQLLLALGAPFGKLAWGGARTTLPPRLRVASGALALALQVGMVLLLERVGALQMIGDPDLAYIGVWVLAGVFTLSALANAASSSSLEKRVMTPITAALAASCLVVALSPVPIAG